MATHPYDVTHDPPLPVLAFILGAPGDEDRIRVMGIADTGADITVVPSTVAEALLAAIGTLRVAGVGGARASATLYRARVEIDGVSDVIEVAAWGDEIIVGRDLLNRCVARFDGPRRVLELTR